MKDGNHLIRQIKLAFPETPIPLEISASTGDEADCARALCSGKRWVQLDPDELETLWGGENFAHVMFYMTDDAFGYYLPAFMSLCAKKADKDTIETINAILFILKETYPDLKGNKFFPTAINTFTSQQKSTISAFLHFSKNAYRSFIEPTIFDCVLEKGWDLYSENQAS